VFVQERVDQLETKGIRATRVHLVLEVGLEVKDGPVIADALVQTAHTVPGGRLETPDRLGVGVPTAGEEGQVAQDAAGIWDRQDSADVREETVRRGPLGGSEVQDNRVMWVAAGCRVPKDRAATLVNWDRQVRADRRVLRVLQGYAAPQVGAA